MYKELVGLTLDFVGHSEEMHVAAREALHWAEISPITLKLLEKLAAYQGQRFTDRRLNVLLGGVFLDNPVMVGAGWDKPGRAVRALHALGFSGVEVGSVLAYPQEGNPKPRQWMIGPGVALNRLGFNHPGADITDRNLQKYKGSGIPIGVSAGKNKDIPDKAAPEMHAVVIKKLYRHAAYFVINVSSPNTPGLRELQDKGPLTDIVQAANQAMEAAGGRKPLFVKIAPDLTNEAVNDVIQVVIDNGLAGIVATNTTINSQIKQKYGWRLRDEPGGVSGDDPDFRRMATEKVAHIFRETQGRIQIIGIGGVKDAETALEKIEAGATVVQVVTAIRGEGPTVAGKINRGLAEIIDQRGAKSINEVIGSETSKY